MPNLTDDEKKTAIKVASDAFKKCKTADEVRSIWKAHYLSLGHRALGRILIGTMDAEGNKAAPVKAEA